MVNKASIQERMTNKAGRRQRRKTLNGLETFIRITCEHFDSYLPAGWDLLIGKIHVSYHSSISRIHAIPKNREDLLKITPIPQELLTRLLAFLEDCVTNRAAEYRRDRFGFAWGVIDDKAYQICCKKFGFSPTDYMIVHPPTNSELMGNLSEY